MPSITRIRIIIPLYESYHESKIIAFKFLSASPFGAGTYFTIASSISFVPIFSFALAGIALPASIPIESSISAFTLSTSADGKSILLITGISSKFWSTAINVFAIV